MTSKDGGGIIGKIGKLTNRLRGKKRNQSSENTPNDYATWTYGLFGLQTSEYFKAKFQMESTKKQYNFMIAKSESGVMVRYSDWDDSRKKWSPESATNFKGFDLGGGDQKILFNENHEKYKQKQPHFKNTPGILLTGGSMDKRLATLSKLLNGGVINEISYALLPRMETKLTALSYYDMAMETMQTKGYGSLCLLPVGSTDAHIIVYKKDGSVETQTHVDYSGEGKPEIKLERCDHYVFAGSATHYVKTEPTDSNVKGVYYDKGNTKSGDFIQFMDKLVLPSLKSPSNEDKSSNEDEPTYSIGGKGSDKVTLSINAIDKCLGIGTTGGGRKNKRTKKNKKIVMKSRRNKKAMRKTKNNKRANRKNKSKRGRR